MVQLGLFRNVYDVHYLSYNDTIPLKTEKAIKNLYWKSYLYMYV